MVVLVAGAHGRLGQRIVALLLHRGHRVRALVRADAQADALRAIGADAVVADLRGDVEWTAEGCDAAVFAAGARHRGELAAVDAGGAAKLAEAADRYELSRFVLCSVIGADRPGRRDGTVGEFLAAKRTRGGRPGAAAAAVDEPALRRAHRGAGQRPGHDVRRAAGSRSTLSRDDAALVVVEALARDQLAHLAVPVIDGDRAVGDALDAIEPRPLPAGAPPGSRRGASLGDAQSDNPPDDPEMIAPDALPLDADVDWEGDGPVPPEPVGNDDPAPGIP